MILGTSFARRALRFSTAVYKRHLSGLKHTVKPNFCHASSVFLRCRNQLRAYLPESFEDHGGQV